MIQICFYNWDETGLYFRNDSKYGGTKAQIAKDHVTLITCTNAAGTHKILLAMIGKAVKPRSFQCCPSPLPLALKEMLMITILTKWWFLDAFLTTIRKR